MSADENPHWTAVEPIRLVFEALRGAGKPDAQSREAIYAACRAKVVAMHNTQLAQERALATASKKRSKPMEPDWPLSRMNTWGLRRVI